MYKQSQFEDDNAEYAAFVEKFKPKKTTDDCYTPENIYNAVADWAANKYGFDRFGPAATSSASTIRRTASCWIIRPSPLWRRF